MRQRAGRLGEQPAAERKSFRRQGVLSLAQQGDEGIDVVGVAERLRLPPEHIGKHREIVMLAKQVVEVFCSLAMRLQFMRPQRR